jgi:hypothetical protein
LDNGKPKMTTSSGKSRDEQGGRRQEAPDATCPATSFSQRRVL